MSALGKSFSAGYACLAAWADLLDRINVFPVADGDTGTNLRISLAPLRNPDEDVETTGNRIARCATGNSGNIAAAFFREFYQAESFTDLAEKAALGRKKAWLAIASPCAGTMLSVFDSLAAILATHADLKTIYQPLRLALQTSVFETTQLLPDLKKADVVDSGALAMYVFFDGFFRHITQQEDTTESIMDIFTGKLAISSAFRQEISNSYCVDVIIQLDAKQTLDGESEEGQATVRSNLAELGESLVVVQDESFLKIHIHTPDPDQLRGRLDSFGDIVQWTDTAIDQRSVNSPTESEKKPILHIVTDAAGSMTREMAQRLGITLLDSYIIVGNDSRPESLYNSEQIYSLMLKGKKITTAQASTFERHQHYQSICRQYGPSLYLCVGAAFTGNYDAVMAWKKDNALGKLLTVINTGAASGRLALIALLTSRYVNDCDSAAEIIAFAEKLVAECVEYVFINELKYLVAGGRVSRASGFFGDLLHMKPVISPTIDGVKKVGIAHSTKGQVAFALEKLAVQCDPSAAPTILLQYSDNEEWVTKTVQPQIRDHWSAAEILLTPLSLTSGVHMGPGTWSIAFASPSRPATD
ncbi:MAG: DegV family EDD domain-containing protein [Proteobacteria bacterium]|nr:DegV family EDD domain-containing protein [Pseudomonadota bacterium]